MLSLTWCSFSNGKRPPLYTTTAQVNRPFHYDIMSLYSHKRVQKYETMGSHFLGRVFEAFEFVPFLFLRSDTTPGADHGPVQVQHQAKDSSAPSRHSGHETPPQRNEEKPGVSHHLWLQSPHGGSGSQTGQWGTGEQRLSASGPLPHTHWHRSILLRSVDQMCWEGKYGVFDLAGAWEERSSRRCVGRNQEAVNLCWDSHLGHLLADTTTVVSNSRYEI